MAGDACRVRPLATVCGRLRVWRDAGVFSALLEGLLAEAAREGIRTCRWSASTPPRLVPVTTPPGCASARTSWTTWKKPLVNRRKPGKKGRAGGTERKGCATTRPAPTQAPAEGSPARQVPRWTHQQGPSRRGPQMPSAHVRPGRGQSAIHPRAQEGEGSPAHRPPPPAPVPARSPPTRPTRPAATMPTCANATSRLSSLRRRTRRPTGRRRAPQAAGPSAIMPTSTRNGTPSSA